MSEVELFHACGAPFRVVDEENAAAWINTGYFTEVPGLPKPLYEDNSQKPCLTCPFSKIVRIGEVDSIVPEGCYIESKLNESLGGIHE